ncbi:4-hydroxy-3-methylbut-2-enyl diphosphate reductase [Stackebrandtia nassauensis]|uniref:4-hydroxy-3-methylbut-2-enyl diphosphate reductase n=1 Tax=Stackebrandtia nassauensis (strain DSM 44728 / CIP 108903 / NRRL B-16338 / NBRC 102104 / LLR-40K-21) TaxID=446470 RepID=D3PZL8_STANL|nr:4-hydroxy-3-methylbut-2-enyl diphosphate reductase [Stackebrandtia nassauensis]ADD41692.1 hydroxymethylbutenyl pyrophosphate reductase [Stackebrandtia nassauensis DSM 44728]
MSTHPPFELLITDHPATTVAGPLPQIGEIVVGTGIVDPGRTVLRAAPVLRGTLTRQGIPARGSDLGSYGGGETEVSMLTVTVEGQPIASLVVRYGDRAATQAATGVLERVRRAWRPRTVLLASPRSYCAGVERAIEVVERALERHGQPVYVRKQIVHNAHVVAELEKRGAVFVDELDQVPDGATVIFSAHGVSPAVRDDADSRGLAAIDATCPLVTKVHAEARRFADRGDTVVLIGHDGHEEVEGTMGEAPESMVLVESVADVERLRVPDPRRLAYLTQTTLAVEETEEIIAALRARFPALRGPGSDDICYATTNRQHAVAAIVDDCDLVLVVGSANSSNSRRLVELAERHGRMARLIDSAEDIELDWLTGADTVGLSAGASAPQILMDEVVETLAGFGPIDVVERVVTAEDQSFVLPREVR